jgi:DNA-binding SARP family transcriptional activator
LRKELVDIISINSNLRGEIGLKLQNNVRLDVAEFENAALSYLKAPLDSLTIEEINHLEQAAALYQGDLAENCFYDWILPERERLRALYLDILSLIMNAYSHQHYYPQAIKTGHQLLQSDPLREDVHRHLMRLYIATGQRSRALQQYMTCWHLLHDELHVAPMPETVALYEQIVGQEPFAELSAIFPSLPSATPPLLPGNLDRLKDLLRHLQAEIQYTLQAIQDVCNAADT